MKDVPRYIDEDVIVRLAAQEDQWNAEAKIATLRTRRDIKEQLQASLPILRKKLELKEQEQKERVIAGFIDLFRPDKTIDQTTDWIKDHQHPTRRGGSDPAFIRDGSTTGSLDRFVQDAFWQDATGLGGYHGSRLIEDIRKGLATTEIGIGQDWHTTARARVRIATR